MTCLIIPFQQNEEANELVESVDSVKNLPQESVAQPPAVLEKNAAENLKDI